jgi:hypothetical protein
VNGNGAAKNAPDTLPADFFSSSSAQAPDTLPADFFSTQQRQVQPQQGMVFGPQAQPEQGFWNRAWQSYAGAIDPFINAAFHPLQTLGGIGQGTVISGTTAGGYPAFAPTGLTGPSAADLQNQQVRQQAQQQALQQGRTMMTEHPAYLAGSLIIPPLVGYGVGKLGPGAPPESLTRGMYSAEGDQIATSLKPSGAGNVDMPAIAHNSLPALRESFADLNADPNLFRGRDGPKLFKDVVQNAIDITEDRTRQALAPILDQRADPKLLAQSPDLVAYIGEDPDSITNQMVNEARKESNKQMSRSNYFLKPQSKQIAAPEATIDALNVGNQARGVLYSTVRDATGIDLVPRGRMESDLIRLSDAANQTNNWLSGKQATFQSAGFWTKTGGALKTAIAAKANPLSALSVTEAPTFLSPLRKFNAGMRDVFGGITPGEASRGVGISMPGKVSPVQVQYPGLPENVPGYTSAIPGQPTYTPPPYQLGPAGRPSSYFPQTTIQGRPVVGSLAQAIAKRGP